MFLGPLKYDADVVHIHQDTPVSTFAGLRYAEKKKKAIVIIWHTDWRESYGNIVRRLGVWMSNKVHIDKLLSKVNIIVVPCKYYIVDSRFLKKYASKIIEIPSFPIVITLHANPSILRRPAFTRSLNRHCRASPIYRSASRLVVHTLFRI